MKVTVDRDPLAAMLAAHDPAALEQLYQYTPRLESALQRRFGTVIDREDVKDIVQDTLLRALQTGHRFDPRAASLETWLNTLAHYEALTFLRTHTNLVHPTTRAALVERCVAELEHQHAMDDQQPSEPLQQLLQELPPKQAMMIYQHYYEGRPYDEIAQFHHVREATVESQLSRARRYLRQRLGSQLML